MEEDEDGHWKLQTLGDLIQLLGLQKLGVSYLALLFSSIFSHLFASYEVLHIQNPSPNHYRLCGIV